LKNKWIAPAVIAAIFATWGIIDELNHIDPFDQVLFAVIFGVATILVAVRSE
jgi:hypothetical protein